MKYFFKLLFVLIFFITLFTTSVYAVEVNMDISNTSTNEISETSPLEEENVLPTNPSSAKVSTTQTSENFSLSISDIISIILIAVGIVLIFLSIAILIRLKN